jgi:hypothetical protein
MLVVIPVNKSDSFFIKPMVDAIKAVQEFYANHELMIVCKNNEEDLKVAEVAFNSCCNTFASEKLVIFSNDNMPSGWPLGPNSYWKETALIVASERVNVPWIWLEPDMTPLKPDWLDILEKEYHRLKKPCMGCLEDSVVHDLDKNPVVIGKHLVGAAIYPPDLIAYAPNIYKVDTINTAFDVVCAYELVPHSAHTELIQHGFRTHNYRFNEAGHIIGSELPSNKTVNGRFNIRINNNAVLHHGCKDGSLAKLIKMIYD